MKRKIALIRDQVSMFPDPDGVKGGEQDEYAGEVARYLGQIGYQVDIFIHKDHQEMLEIDEWADNVRIIHVPGGGADLKNAHRENLPDAMQEFTGYLLGFCNRQDKTYDLIHADSWASGWVAAEIKAALGTPFVLTFPGRQHEWTTPKKDHTLFAERQLEAEDRILRDVDAIVTGSSNGRQALISLYDADPAYIVQIPSMVTGEDRQTVEPTEPWNQNELGKGEHKYETGSAAWQKLANLFVEIYENVLAVRRVAVIPADSTALAMGQPDYSNRLNHVDHAFETALQMLHETRVAMSERILEAANLISECLQQGGKIMVCGVGQADGDARHFRAELMERALPVLLLAANTSSLEPSEDEAVSVRILARQVEVLGHPGDLLVGITTGEGSISLAEAFRCARLYDIRSLSLTGSPAGGMLPDVALVIPSSDPQRVREVELLVLNLLCDLLPAQSGGTPQIPAESLFHTGEALTLLKKQVE